jgi:hypothetical protein
MKQSELEQERSKQCCFQDSLGQLFHDETKKHISEYEMINIVLLAQFLKMASLIYLSLFKIQILDLQ